MKEVAKATSRSAGEGHGPPAAGFSFNTRWAVLAACAGLVILLSALYAGVMVIDLAEGLLADGVMVLGWIASAGLLGWVFLRGFRVADAPLPLRFATAIALGLGCFSILALLLGCAGWLNRWTALLLPLASVAAGGVMQWRLGRVWERGEAAWERAQAWLKHKAGWSWLVLLAMPFLSILIVGASVMPGFLWRPFDPHPYDVMEYHLQVPREWYDAGRIHPLYHNIYNFFPDNMEMHFLLMMHARGGPWQAMYMAQYFSAACMVLAMFAIFATVRTIGDTDGERGRGAVLAAVAAAVVPWVTMLGAVAFVESMLMLFATLALAWTIRAMRSQTKQWRMMLLGGILAGVACGVKYTAVPVVLLLLPGVYFLLTLVRTPKLAGRAFAACATFGLAGLLVFSPWLVRNAAWTGNPIYPLEMKRFGQGHLDDAQVERWDRAHKVAATHASLAGRLTLARQGLIDWQYGFIFMPMAAAALLILVRRPAGQFLLLACALQLVFWITFTHLMPRFAILLVPLGAIAIGLAAGGRLFPVGVAGTALLTALSFFGLPVSERSTRSLGLHEVFTRYVSGGTEMLIRWENLDALTPDLQKMRTPDAKLAMIGDVQPFFHRFAPGQIEYRTVFDVRFPPGVRLVDAWLGRDVRELQKDHILFIHPGELRRLAATYHGVPPLEEDWLDHLKSLYTPIRPVWVSGNGSEGTRSDTPILFPRKP